MTQSSGKWLKQILQQMKSLSQSQQKTLAVFDLDSTLFDVSPRLQQILHDFADRPEIQDRFPESIALLRTARTERSDWGIRQALQRAGLQTHSEEFHQAVKDFWIESFFTNHYLQYDQVYPGAAEFVTQAQASGCEIIYLSGRDHEGMWDGTLQALTQHGFPVNAPREQIVLKPIKGSDDALFKRDWFLKLPENEYARIWFFENEPVNVLAIQEHLPQVEIVFIESTHSGKAEIPAHLPKIFHFRLDED